MEPEKKGIPLCDVSPAVLVGLTPVSFFAHHCRPQCYHLNIIYEQRYRSLFNFIATKFSTVLIR